MLRLIFAVAIVVAVIWAMKTIRQLPPEQRKKRYISLGIGGFAGLLIVLAITGRVHWIGAAIGALLPIARALGPSLLRYLPGLISKQSGAAGNPSQVSTDSLTMTLDQSRSALDGAIHKGPFSGQRLSELSEEELKTYRHWCEQNDSDAVTLLDNYHQFRFAQQGSRARNSQGLSLEDARAILGLKPPYERDAVIKAHRQLMQKLHPDRGGNDFLAGQLNAAKDCLLEELEGH